MDLPLRGSEGNQRSAGDKDISGVENSQRRVCLKGSMAKKSTQNQNIGLFGLAIVLTIALAIAAFLRLDNLGDHPLHADEAVQGIKFEEFLDSGTFDYDPKEYHGPLPHYLGKATLAATGRPDRDFAGRRAPLSDEDLRLAPAICGILVVALLAWLAAICWGTAGVLPVVVLAAVSPSLVYYSRYWIAEMPFVLATCLFLIGTVRFFDVIGAKGDRKDGNPIPWAILAGVGAGLMHTAKETCVLSFTAAAIAAVVCWGISKKHHRGLLIGLVSGTLCSVALFSDFFRSWGDVGESIGTYFSYLKRAGGAGHEHPWWFYLQRYGWFRGGYRWTEIAIFGFGMIGFIMSWVRGNRTVRFLGLYALILLGIYMVIPYKTPWSVLPAIIAWFPLAGWMTSQNRNTSERAVWLIVLIGFSIHLGIQARRATHKMPTDPRNPYAYVHTAPALFELLETLPELETARRRINGVASSKDSIPDIVVVDPLGAWPLPWYLRGLDVDYLNTLPQAPKTPLTLVAGHVFPDPLPTQWQTMHSTIYNLRSDAPFVLFIDSKVWAEFLAERKRLRQEQNSVQ